jgi:hypothetical protein
MMSITLAMNGCESPEDQSIVDAAVHGTAQKDAVFDCWLNHHLSRLYVPVLDEPIPDELLQQLRERLG